LIDWVCEAQERGQKLFIYSSLFTI